MIYFSPVLPVRPLKSETPEPDEARNPEQEALQQALAMIEENKKKAAEAGGGLQD